MNLEKALKIRGWMSELELGFLASVALECKNIIEVGCYEGRSCRAMADNTSGRIYAVDPWDCPVYSNENKVIYRTSDETRHVFYVNLYDKIKDGTVILKPKEFHYSDFDGLEISPECEISWDFVFIDADHRYESVKSDIRNALKLNPRLIAGHDYCSGWDGVIKAVDEYFPNSTKVDTIWWQLLK